jgi:hypothetical protein
MNLAQTKRRFPGRLRVLNQADKELADDLVRAIRAVQDSKDIPLAAKMTALTALYGMGWMASYDKDALARMMNGTLEEFNRRKKGS